MTKNKKIHAALLILSGLIIIGCGLYVYFVAHTIYPHSGSSRVQDLNWLLRTFGKTGTAALFIFIGFFPFYWGTGKLRRKNK